MKVQCSSTVSRRRLLISRGRHPSDALGTLSKQRPVRSQSLAANTEQDDGTAMLVSKMLISIVLLLITSRIRSVPAQNDYAESDAFHISLTEEELRGISELEPDEEDSHDTGQFMNDFFHDSQSQ